MNPRLAVLLLLLPVLSGSLRADDEIDSLLERLASDDWARREAATEALRTRGPEFREALQAAWRAAESRIETRARLAGILAGWGHLPDIQADRRLGDDLEALRDERPEVRLTALARILAADQAGFLRLQQALSRPQKEFGDLAVVGDRLVARPGESLSISISVTNTGEDGFWFDPSHHTVPSDPPSFRSFARNPIVGGPIRMGGSNWNFGASSHKPSWRDLLQALIRSIRWIDPGQVVPLTREPISFTPTIPGIHPIGLEYHPRSRREIRGPFGTIDTRPLRAGGRGLFRIVACVGRQEHRDDGLSISVRAETAPAGGDPSPLSIRITNEGRSARRIGDIGAVRSPAWIVIVDDDGKFVRSGSIHTGQPAPTPIVLPTGHDSPGRRFDEVEIGPGGEIVRTIELRPLPPGRYRISIGTYPGAFPWDTVDLRPTQIWSDPIEVVVE